MLCSTVLVARQYWLHVWNNSGFCMYFVNSEYNRDSRDSLVGHVFDDLAAGGIGISRVILYMIRYMDA